MARKELLSRLVQCMRLYQINGRFVGNAFETNIPGVDCYMLLELASDSSVKLSRMAARLNLDRSSISRKMASLVERGFVKEVPLSHDGRRKRFFLTDRAEEFLSLYDRRTLEILSGFSSLISNEELDRLTHYFKALADGGGAPEALPYPREPTIFTQARRLPGLFRIFNKNFAESKFSHLEWHVLSILAYAVTPTRPSDICNVLRVNPNTISQLVLRLVENGLVNSERMQEDRRNVLLSLTTVGKKEVRSIERCQRSIFKKSLSALNEKELEEFVNIFQTFVGLNPDGSKPVLNPTLQVVRVVSESERQEHRLYLLQTLSGQNELSWVQEQVLAADSLTFSLRHNTAIAGVCELQAGKDAWELVHFACSDENDGPFTAQGFLFRALEEALIAGQKPKGVLIPERFLTEQYARGLPGKKRANGSKVITKEALAKLRT